MSKEVGANTAGAAAAHPHPHGILVTSHIEHKRSGGIKWDEAVIEEHNLLRGTRAPIGEPKTPFNRERIDDGDDDEPGPINPAELASRLAMLQEAGDEQQEQEEAAAAQQQQEEDFKEKRRKHYNEFLESKLRLQALEEEDEDEDADD